jgi:hypothetical protein
VPAASTGYVVGWPQAFSIVQAGGHVDGCVLLACAHASWQHTSAQHRGAVEACVCQHRANRPKHIAFRAGACVLRAGVRCRLSQSTAGWASTHTPQPERRKHDKMPACMVIPPLPCARHVWRLT